MLPGTERRTGRSAHIAAVLALGLAVAAAPASAQTPSPPRITALVGAGHDMGWFGGQAEGYILQRLSLFAGLGYTPDIENDNPTGATFAFGVRQYAGGQRHRVFLQASVSQVMVTTRGETGSGERFYGPGIQAGYSFLAPGGLTALVSAGVGYALGLDAAESSDDFATLFNVGIGYTWR